MNFIAISIVLLLLHLIVFLNYFLSKYKLNNYFIFIISIVFYCVFSINFYDILNILAIILITYFIGKILFKNKNKLLVFIYLFLVVGNLAFFKYNNYFLKNNFIMPLGISFITFQAISYVLDIFNSKIHKINIFDLSRYLLFFPTTFQGPIIRYNDFISFKYHKVKLDDILDGYRLYIIGFAKKVIIADTLIILANYTFANKVPYYLAFLGALAYMLMIYYDFSGYSDMAKASAKMIGYDIMNNFNYPYSAKSITDFWKRWHISLSLWFKDYVYIALGGNRCGIIKNIFNLLVVWLITGIWHGSKFNYILWGLYFFALLVIEKYIFKGKNNYFVTMFLVFISWIIFRSEDPFSYFKMMFDFSVSFNLIYLKLLDVLYLWPIIVIALIGIYPTFNEKILNRNPLFKDIYLVLILIIGIIFLINNNFEFFSYVGF